MEDLGVIIFVFVVILVWRINIFYLFIIIINKIIVYVVKFKFGKK